MECLYFMYELVEAVCNYFSILSYDLFSANIDPTRPAYRRPSGLRRFDRNPPQHDKVALPGLTIELWPCACDDCLAHLAIPLFELGEGSPGVGVGRVVNARSTHTKTRKQYDTHVCGEDEEVLQILDSQRPLISAHNSELWEDSVTLYG